MEIPFMIRLGIGAVAGFLAIKLVAPGLNMQLEDDRRSAGWIVLIVAGVVAVMLETIIGILFVAGLFACAVYAIPYVIRLFARTAERTMEEIHGIKSHRREPTAPAIPDLRRDIDRLVDEDGNVPAEVVRELLGYSEPRDGAVEE